MTILCDVHYIHSSVEYTRFVSLDGIGQIPYDIERGEVSEYIKRRR